MEDVNAYFNLVYDATFSGLAKVCVLKAKTYTTHLKRHAPPDSAMKLNAV